MADKKQSFRKPYEQTVKPVGGFRERPSAGGSGALHGALGPCLTDLRLGPKSQGARTATGQPTASHNMLTTHTIIMPYAFSAYIVYCALGLSSPLLDLNAVFWDRTELPWLARQALAAVFGVAIGTLGYGAVAVLLMLAGPVRGLWAAGALATTFLIITVCLHTN